MKASINTCRYKIVWKKAQALKMCFLTLAEWYFPAQKKKPLGRTRENLQDEQILCHSLCLLCEGRMCLQCTCVRQIISHRVGSHSWRGAKINCCSAEMRSLHQNLNHRPQDTVTYCRMWVGLTMQMIVVNTKTKKNEKAAHTHVKRTIALQ